jgi:hypothetical protein
MDSLHALDRRSNLGPGPVPVAVLEEGGIASPRTRWRLAQVQMHHHLERAKTRVLPLGERSAITILTARLREMSSLPTEGDQEASFLTYTYARASAEQLVRYAVLSS